MSMPPIISIVGKSGSGKTTLLESLITELEQRGHRVAVIKHAAHDFEVDIVNKDSWRFSQVGTEVVVISSPCRVAVIKRVERDYSPEELSHFIGVDYDLILTEGFRRSNTPKIEVHRQDQGEELLCPPQQLLAIVTDEPLSVAVSQFSKGEVQRLTDLIEDWLLSQR